MLMKIGAILKKYSFIHEANMFLYNSVVRYYIIVDKYFAQYVVSLTCLNMMFTEDCMVSNLTGRC